MNDRLERLLDELGTPENDRQPIRDVHPAGRPRVGVQNGSVVNDPGPESTDP